MLQLKPSCTVVGLSSRVLQPGASLLVVTYGEPAARVPLLTQPGMSWRVSMYVVGKSDTPVLGPKLSPIVVGPVDVQSVVSASTCRAAVILAFNQVLLVMLCSCCVLVLCEGFEWLQLGKHVTPVSAIQWHRADTHLTYQPQR